MEFESGKSYFCKKNYGEENQSQVNQFLSYTQPRPRYGFRGSNSYDYDWEMYYTYGMMNSYCNSPRFTAGYIYRCRLNGTLTDDKGMFIHTRDVNPDDFIEIKLEISDSAKKMIDSLSKHRVSVEILPESVVGGEVKDGIVENPNTTVTSFKLQANRVGAFNSAIGHPMIPPITEMKKYEVVDSLSKSIDNALYDTWKRIRIQSSFCKAVIRVLNSRGRLERYISPNNMTYTSFVPVNSYRWQY